MQNLTVTNPPKHVGIIMDGNGRWAKLKNKQRSYGHKQGAKIIEDIALCLFESGVKYLSLYAFSTENFNRPQQEVNTLFDILEKGIEKYGELALKKNIRLTVSGDISVLNQSLQNKINRFKSETKKYETPVLHICLNYGARQEICRAFSLMQKNEISVCNEQILEQYLYTSEFPPVDLIIRTGGEYRLSNFLLWQSAYAELYFTDVLWPDFKKENAVEALLWYQSRNRRFGKV